MAAGQLAQAEQELALQLAQPDVRQGEVALVGAGPGDAGLLTLRGLQVIQQADVVLYDHLVSDEVLDLVRRDAERICVGKRASAHLLPQDEINALLVKLAQEGKRVVRLKAAILLFWSRRRRVAAGGAGGHSVSGGAGHHRGGWRHGVCRHSADAP